MSAHSDFPAWLQESNERLVVLAFEAEWVGTVAVLRGFLTKISRAHSDVSVKWIDIDEAPQLTIDMGVNQIPSVILLRNQEVVDHIDGLIPRRRLLARIEQYL